MNWKKANGWLNEKQARELQKIAKEKTVLEIGSFKGKSTLALAEVAELVVSIDCFKKNIKKSFNENTGMKSNIISLNGTSEDLFKYWNSKVDVVFIDGTHDFASIQKDCRYAGWLKKDGFLAFHDYGDKEFPDVKKFVNKRVKPNSKYSVFSKQNSLIVFKKVSV